MAHHFDSDDSWKMPGVLWSRVLEFRREGEKAQTAGLALIRRSSREWQDFLDWIVTRQFLMNFDEHTLFQALEDRDPLGLSPDDHPQVLSLLYWDVLLDVLDNLEEVLARYYMTTYHTPEAYPARASEFASICIGPIRPLIERVCPRWEADTERNGIWYQLWSPAVIIRKTTEDTIRSLRIGRQRAAAGGTLVRQGAMHPGKPGQGNC